MRISEITIQSDKKTGLSPDVSVLLKDLGSRNGLVRETARARLVEMGGAAVEYLSDLVEKKNDVARWEAVKALSEIGKPSSVPVLIRALYDGDEEIRWIAAEGLIAIGRDAVEPLLRELLTNPRSFKLKKGAHHVLKGVNAVDRSMDYSELINALNDHATKIHLPMVAYKYLRKVRKLKSEHKAGAMRPGLH